jgi:hypothetical protein
MRIRFVLAAAALAACLAGCTSGVTPVPQVSIPGLVGGGGPAATAAPLRGTDVCAAFPLRAVAKASGWRLNSATPAASTVGTAASFECRYAGADGVLRLAIVPGGGDAALTALIASPDLGGGAIVVTGVGDAAQAAIDGMVVRYGDDVVAVIEQPAVAPLRLSTAQGLVGSLRGRLAR